MKQIYHKIFALKGNLITLRALGVFLGEMAQVRRKNGMISLASVIAIDGELVTLQSFESSRGVATCDEVIFLGKSLQAIYSQSLLGRKLNGAGEPIDGGAKIVGEGISLVGPSFNPVRRVIPREMVRTNIPMIDLFNCLVRSQKIPIFSVAGEPYNQLLMRIANQTDADVVVVGGMGLRYDDYQLFVENSELHGSASKSVMFIHQASDPAIECLLVPDLALACAERFALEEKNVLVLLTDMTAFADAMKEIMITMDQIPANRGYPGSLYSDLAARYEKAVEIEGKGSITIIAVTTMPGGDVTHPVPDNTGYITEGQFYLHGGRIDPFGSLSRLKQQVIGKVTRGDHEQLANTLIRLYADSKKARERKSMGFKLSRWDQKLLKFSELFDEKLMSLEVNLPLDKALDTGWEILANCFESQQLGMKQSLIDQYWPRVGE